MNIPSHPVQALSSRMLYVYCRALQLIYIQIRKGKIKLSNYASVLCSLCLLHGLLSQMRAWKYRQFQGYHSEHMPKENPTREKKKKMAPFPVQPRIPLVIEPSNGRSCANRVLCFRAHEYRTVRLAGTVVKEKKMLDAVLSVRPKMVLTRP